MGKTNIYGPRPRDGGFRCKYCGSGDYPLFGFSAPTGGKFSESSTNTVCAPCLGAGNPGLLSLRPTYDARRALEAQDFDFRCIPGGHPG